MKSKTSNFEDTCWLISAISLILYPIGFIIGLLSVGFILGFNKSHEIVDKVNKKVQRIIKDKKYK